MRTRAKKNKQKWKDEANARLAQQLKEKQKEYDDLSNSYESLVIESIEALIPLDRQQAYLNKPENIENNSATTQDQVEATNHDPEPEEIPEILIDF